MIPKLQEFSLAHWLFLLSKCGQTLSATRQRARVDNLTIFHRKKKQIDVVFNAFGDPQQL